MRVTCIVKKCWTLFWAAFLWNVGDLFSTHPQNDELTFCGGCTIVFDDLSQYPKRAMEGLSATTNRAVALSSEGGCRLMTSSSSHTNKLVVGAVKREQSASERSGDAVNRLLQILPGATEHIASVVNQGAAQQEGCLSEELGAFVNRFLYASPDIAEHIASAVNQGAAKPINGALCVAGCVNHTSADVAAGLLTAEESVAFLNSMAQRGAIYAFSEQGVSLLNQGTGSCINFAQDVLPAGVNHAFSLAPGVAECAAVGVNKGMAKGVDFSFQYFMASKELAELVACVLNKRTADLAVVSDITVGATTSFANQVLSGTPVALEGLAALGHHSFL